MNYPPYVLITPARNEEALIDKLLESVTRQTLLPLRWVIVNDGSTDRTAEIVSGYLARYPWIEMVTLPEHRDRSFAGKVHAFNAGWDTVKGLDYEVIANLDSDVSFDPDYCEFLIGKFGQDSSLGVAGTIFYEEGYSSETDSYSGRNHVSGGCQFFRRQCFDEVGGYVPNPAGGVDWIAVTTARMKGWRTCSYREKSFFHYRSLGTAERSFLAAAFSYGEKDYYLGNHPLWELIRILYRSTRKPYVLKGAAVAAGYLSAAIRQIKRPVSHELMQFHRREEMLKLKNIVLSLFRLRPVHSFEVKPN